MSGDLANTYNLQILDTLTDLIRKRHKEAKENKNLQNNSYTTQLFQKGRSYIARKVGEEALEVILAAMENNAEQTAMESADLLYHLLVLLEDCGIDMNTVCQILQKRQGISGIEEKANR